MDILELACESRVRDFLYRVSSSTRLILSIDIHRPLPALVLNDVLYCTLLEDFYRPHILLSFDPSQLP